MAQSIPSSSRRPSHAPVPARDAGRRGYSGTQRVLDYAGVQGSRRAHQKWARQVSTDMQCVTARISEMHPPRIAARI